MKVAVLGAGAAGCTVAADIGSKGHEVRLYDLPQFSRTIDTIRGEGIHLVGELTSTYTPDRLTTDLQEAVDGADIVMLTVPGFAHQTFMDACLPSFSRNQVVLNWTSYWSCMRFLPQAQKIGRRDIVLAEASILPFMTEKTPEGNVFVRAVKQELWVAAMPATKTDEVMKIVEEIYPQAVGVENVLVTSLNNLNVPFHVVTAMMNAGHWEQTTGDFDFFGYGITPAVGRVADAVDHERLAVARAMGVNSPSLPELMNKVYGKYGATGPTMYDVLHGLKSHATWRPRVKLLDYGDVREDVPFGLVPLSSLGDQFDVPTPMIDVMIHLAGVATQKDFRAIGADAEKLGVKGMTPSAITRYVTTGQRT
jgi:opine dehydrogenase